jgi:KUP system potassium uptake protein
MEREVPRWVAFAKETGSVAPRWPIHFALPLLHCPRSVSACFKPNPSQDEPPLNDSHTPGTTDSRNLLRLSLGALGVVYGDIGTSPLYAVRECFHGAHAIEPSAGNVLGVLSLIFWSLLVIVTLKYTLYVLRADNKGEGGILALTALATAGLRDSGRGKALILIGLFGSALLYGDGMITPAISVLSAVEGLRVAAPSLDFLVIPITIAILIGLFTMQKRGTGSIGALFGPITLCWFVAIGCLGLYRIVENPAVIVAANPLHAVEFFVHNGWLGLATLGSVFLVVTGGEALYADLGHFGRKPIQAAWFALVFPALSLCYLGQGALLLQRPEAAENLFFQMGPSWTLYPMVALSTCATVIASQALISGVYSLTSQATMLGFMPRLDIRHTSAEERGQIYMPTVNAALMVCTIGLVLGFRSSQGLAAAYGVAVTLTMAITTVLALFVARWRWGWSWFHASLLTLLFLVPELCFVGANIPKIDDGGWFPLVLGALLFTLMTTWQRGRKLLFQRFQEQLLPLSDFFDLMHVERPARAPGTAVFMTGSRDGTPPALLHNFVHNHVVHQNIVLVTILYHDVARISEAERYEVEELEHGFRRFTGHFGFMENPDVPKLLAHAQIIHSLEHTTFFLGRENLIVSERPGMARWRAGLFAGMARNAQSATKFFNIPPDRVMELGAQVTL